MHLDWYIETYKVVHKMHIVEVIFKEIYLLKSHGFQSDFYAPCHSANYFYGIYSR